MGMPRVQITLGRMMLVVSVVGVVLWFAMVAEYHLSGRAHDDWVDTPSTSASYEYPADPATIESTTASAK